jgi:hypothetical protein
MHLEHVSCIQQVTKNDHLLGEIISGEIPPPPGKASDHDLSTSAQFGGNGIPPLIWEFILSLMQSGIERQANSGNRHI